VQHPEAEEQHVGDRAVKVAKPASFPGRDRAAGGVGATAVVLDNARAVSAARPRAAPNSPCSQKWSWAPTSAYLGVVEVARPRLGAVVSTSTR